MQETDPRIGLRYQQVEQARMRSGSNTLTFRRSRSFLAQLADNLSDPIIKIMVAALCVNLLLIFRGEGWFESVGIALAILAASLISTLSEYSSEKAFLRLREEAAKVTCRARREALLLDLPADALVEGDIVLLEAGEGIPADGVLIRGALQCDQSALTGESREIAKTAAPFFEPERWDLSHPSLLFRGSTVAAGEGILQVTRVGDQTLLGSMAQSLQESPRESPLKLRLSALAKSMSRVGYLAAGLVAVADLFHHLVMDNGFVPSLIRAELTHLPSLAALLLHAATLAISVIIVAVPEGLPMMITVVLSRSMLKMQRDQVMVRKLTGIETAGSLDLLLTDKTGTLTRGRLTVEGFLFGDGQIAKTDDLPKHPAVWKALRESCLINTASQWSDAGGAPHPVGGNATDRALLELAGTEPTSARKIRSVPFDSERKYAAAEVENGAFCCYLKGAPELLLPRCSSFLAEEGVLPLHDPEKLQTHWRERAQQGERVVCICAGERADKGSKLILLGLALMCDPLRPETPAAVRRLHSAGVQVVMVTGDSPETARAIASSAGLLRGGGQIITSKDLAQMTDRQVQQLLPQLRVVARALPTDKSRLVRVAQQMDHVVGMTGDGVNDAPALRLADVGFSMGSGTRVAKEAGDIVILDDNIASVCRAILYGRTIFRSIRRFLVFQLVMNFTAVAVSVAGPFLGVETPVTVIQMLWINLIMDTLAGLAFAGEAPQEALMEQPPIPRSAPVVTGEMKRQIAGLSFYLTLLCSAFLRLPLFRRLFPQEDAFLTAFFALFVFSGLAAAFCARREDLHLLRGLKENRSFLLIIAVTAAVQIGMIYFGGTLFRTCALPLSALERVLLLSASVVPASQLGKLLFQKR